MLQFRRNSFSLQTLKSHYLSTQGIANKYIYYFYYYTNTAHMFFNCHFYICFDLVNKIEYLISVCAFETGAGYTLNILIKTKQKLPIFSMSNILLFW